MKMEVDMKKIINFLFEIGTLKNIVRSDRQVLPEENSTVASHSFRCAIIGYFLARLENVNKDKVLKMCLFHDIYETRTGDANFINKFYIQQNIERAYKDQLEGLSQEVITLLDEFIKGESREAIVARDADILEQIFTQREIISKSEDFKKWHEFQHKRLKTVSAQIISQEIPKTNPLEWIYQFPH
jgi:putative hydrolase of HD superfamily